MKIVVIAILLFTFAADSAAQQTRARFGPVVTAYLTGLAEELNELEYQRSRGEIARADYERAKSRLTLLRRLVERHATKSREDAVPEYQILAEDELKTLGTSGELQPDQLVAGAEVENQWKLVGIEPGAGQKRARLFVFEPLPQKELSSRADAIRERKREFDVQAIETVVVNERPLEREPPPPQPGPASTVQVQSPQPNADQPARAKPQIQLPRILHIFLPEYTDKARQKQIEGDLVVSARFQNDGKIKEIKVEKGLGHGLDGRATDAVKRIGFTPARVDGHDVDARAEIVFNFTLAKVSVYVRSGQDGVMAKGAKP
ncbi:MAG: energy transducer TonB [Blastocatellia bacterium]